MIRVMAYKTNGQWLDPSGHVNRFIRDTVLDDVLRLDYTTTRSKANKPTDYGKLVEKNE